MPSVEIVETNQTPKLVAQAFFEAAKQQMERAMIVAESEIKRITPTRSGHLRQSITHHVVVQGKMIIGEVGTNVIYGPWQEEGTGMYGRYHSPIVPKRASALRFPTPGNSSFTLAGRQRSGKAGANASWVIVRSVKGVKPRHFFRDGYATAAGQMKQELDRIPQVAQEKLRRLVRVTKA